MKTLYIALTILFGVFAFKSEASVSSFQCGGYKMSVETITMSQPLIATISFHEGTWIEIPDNGNPNPMSTVFYNTQSSKLALVGVDAEERLVLQIYRDIDFFHAKFPLLSTYCKEVK